ncbi:unnamed protein product [Paramecium sonneborni]|uniref:non-specific serine/threonine protein kinase n=1 Tax=Paramecium sonneborni TaxID=65129 RepID=A0A8S1Q0S3_9CILI|nr:unnamed protein product [Paramecium sonneborni]
MTVRSKMNNSLILDLYQLFLTDASILRVTKNRCRFVQRSLEILRRIDHQIYAMKKQKWVKLMRKKNQMLSIKFGCQHLQTRSSEQDIKKHFIQKKHKPWESQSEYAYGGNIAKQITSKQNKTQKFQEQEIQQALVQITQSLKELHEKLIFHRNIKSANIFISNEVNNLVYQMHNSLEVYYTLKQVFHQIESMYHQKYESCTRQQQIRYLQNVFYKKRAISILHFKLQIWDVNTKRSKKESSLQQMVYEFQFSRLSIKTPIIAINKRMIKTIQLPKHRLNNITTTNYYENQENNNESVRYSVQSSKFIPLNRTSVNNS